MRKKKKQVIACEQLIKQKENAEKEGKKLILKVDTQTNTAKLIHR